MTLRLLTTGVAICLAGTVSAGTLTDTYTSFYSFGDSLTDDGKFGVFSAANPFGLLAPTDGGRFSNGPTWSEFVEAEFEAAGRDTGNLALGGATSGSVNLNSPLRLSTFDGQIEAFSDALAGTLDPFTGLPAGLPTDALEIGNTGAIPTPGDNPLVSLWFGANNIFQGLDPTLAAQEIGNGIRDIAALDPTVFDDFFVARIGYFSGLPAFAGAPGFGALLDANIDIFNAQLTTEIISLRSDGFNIIDFDSAPIFAAIEDDIDNNGGQRFGILDADLTCIPSFSFDPTAPVVAPCTNPDELLFNDSVHPNAVAQSLIGAAALAAITPAPVPLPASLPLILAGFGALGAVRLRSRRKAA